MDALKQLETALSDVFVKKAPALPENTKKALVQYVPWVNLILGLLALWAAYNLWQWAHWVDRLVDYTNSLTALYGAPAPTVSRLSLAVWLSLAVLVVEAVIYIAAFSPLRARKKQGWNLLFYAMLVNVVYGLVVMFTDYGGPGSFVGSVIGTVIGLYFLFQIRDQYNGKPVSTTKSTTPKDKPSA
jgi:hypothetical protein